jgi:hypothetical protein
MRGTQINPVFCVPHVDYDYSYKPPLGLFLIQDKYLNIRTADPIITQVYSLIDLLETDDRYSDRPIFRPIADRLYVFK